MLAHMGVSVSLGTTRNTVKSLRKHANARLKSLTHGNMIYDNFDMDFKVAQPTAGHQGWHMSATVATFTPYLDLEPGDLRFTKELHATSRFNKDLSPNSPLIYRPVATHILPGREEVSASGLNSVDHAFAWLIREILVEQEPAFKMYKSALGLPEKVYLLPVQKTEQFPANSINADEGQNDGNWSVLTNLLDQVSSPT